jgi:hypothetical protein
MTNLDNSPGYRRQRGNRQSWQKPQTLRIPIGISASSLPLLGHGLYVRKNTKPTYNIRVTKHRITKLTNAVPCIGILKFVGYCLAAMALLPLFFLDARPYTTSNWRSPI